MPLEKVDGDPHTVKLLFRWTDDKHIRARNYDELAWNPALFHARVIREPTRDARGRKQYATRRENGMHGLRHYYASITLADGVNIKNSPNTSATETQASPSGSTPTCCRHRTSGRGRLSNPVWPVSSPSDLTKQ
ncbi:hypothetical protein GCM10010522_20050 [Kribbella solani]